MMKRRMNKAFTLVEILIVVVILGILAAIVIPQFTRASQEAQVGNVQSQLQTIKSQIELFRIRNNGNDPFDASWAGSRAADSNGWGNLLNPPGGEEPYFRSAPVNPRNRSDAIAAGTTPAAGDTNGWFWDGASRTFRAGRFDEVQGQWMDDPNYTP